MKKGFLFPIPVFFGLSILLLFYILYCHCRRMRTSNSFPSSDIDEAGLKKELREMLPIIVFKESFSITDNQCSVCLADYQTQDRLQQIPGCGHTFHLDCIDLWLAKNTTCPLCRKPLLGSAAASSLLHEQENGFQSTTS